MLTNHWLVALFGSVPTLAIATVPRMFERVAPNSFWIAPRDVTYPKAPVVVETL
jgi:hypothetical protein